ncbi:Der1-like family-domain-containing protein [Pyronema domesticum]|uniref:Derlin n=1 Tax=Pyronema omphalodes (strain CBS 100304) TaxID=1076935 RepID=U4LWD3_PYROM|nr:Der1-like family-domain-containing protein [Pyronema domesticum]CCX33596.1 Similar to Derlin-3; acc. no. Q9D8K3 [Pyronema omphalodes CBS 100304]
MADIGEFFSSAPPVSRALAGATLIISFSSHVLHLVNPMNFVYFPDYVFNTQSMQFWRLGTSFLLSRPQLGVLLDPFFLYRYASDCERVLLARKGDFTIFLLFVGSIIIALNTFLHSAYSFISPLMLALAYYWSAFEDPASRVNFFIATFPVKFLPWVMLLMSLVQGGDVINDLTGLVAAHAYLFLTDIWPRHGGGRNWLQWPADVVQGWWEVAERAVPAPPRVVPAAGPVRVGGIQGSTAVPGRAEGWRHRGQGQRLGS